MIDLKMIQKAITQENLGGWLFFNFHHRDDFSDRFLGIPRERMNSRRWFYFIPASGEPTKICHAIEKGSLKELPGKTVYYSSQDELQGILSPLACPCAASYSETLATLSYLDHGTARLLERWGFDLKPAEGLVQDTLGVLDEEQMASHQRAAIHLYEIIDLLWTGICKAFIEGKELTELEVQGWIYDEFKQRDLITEHTPIVAAGSHSGDPHYAPSEPATPLKRGDTIQFDIWAKEKGPKGTFADISWVGHIDSEAPSEVTETFNLIRDARNRGVEVIRESLTEKRDITGAEVDREVRKVIIEGGQGEYLCHRTGHGIDVELHGWGVNLDCVEFPDTRFIKEGSCFSVEPGLYKEKFGCRTEIDAYVHKGVLVISGGPIQSEILLLK